MKPRLEQALTENADELNKPLEGLKWMSNAKEVTEERNATHGDWLEQSYRGFHLKMALRDGENWSKMTPSQREALDMIATKISRILTGNPHEPDHWADIEGYAYLARKEIER